MSNLESNDFKNQWQDAEKLNSVENFFNALVKYMAVVLTEEGVTYVHSIGDDLDMTPGEFMQHYRYKFNETERKIMDKALNEAQKMIKDNEKESVKEIFKLGDLARGEKE